MWIEKFDEIAEGDIVIPPQNWINASHIYKVPFGSYDDLIYWASGQNFTPRINVYYVLPSPDYGAVANQMI